MLADCHQILVELRSQVMDLQLLQEGVDNMLKMLQKNKELEKSSLDLVRLLVEKTAQCEALAKKNVEPTQTETNTIKSPLRKIKQRKSEEKYTYSRELHYTKL